MIRVRAPVDDNEADALAILLWATETQAADALGVSLYFRYPLHRERVKATRG